MFIPFYEDRSKFDIAAELFADTAWCLGYAVGFAIGVYRYLAQPTETVVEVSQPVANVNQLRDLCKASGIRWNRAGDGGKHLTKKEMIAKLQEVVSCR